MRIFRLIEACFAFFASCVSYGLYTPALEIRGKFDATLILVMCIGYALLIIICLIQFAEDI